jgi:hypothetical protein
MLLLLYWKDVEGSVASMPLKAEEELDILSNIAVFGKENRVRNYMKGR